MNQTPETTAMRGGLPAIGEFLRAVPGFVAIIVLLGIVVGSDRFAELDHHLAVVAPAAPDVLAAEHAKQAPMASPSLPAQQETMAFYLVATPAQEGQVDWGENVDANDHWRRYRILYARNDTELQAAHQTVIDYMLSRADTVGVRLVDARTW